MQSRATHPLFVLLKLLVPLCYTKHSHTETLATACVVCVQWCRAALLHLKWSLLALDVEREGVLAHAHFASSLHSLPKAASINAEVHIR